MVDIENNKNYLITLTPLEPFFFGGDVTFGAKGDKENGTYLVRSRHFPQQTALLGMIRKEMLVQAELLTRKVRGEWIDSSKKEHAKRLVGATKFSFDTEQDFGDLHSISPLFLVRKSDGKRFIKKVAIDNYELIGSDALASPRDGATAYRLKKRTYRDDERPYYSDKENINDNFTATDNSEHLRVEEIFESIEQIGNSKFDSKNSLYKKTSYILKSDFRFALHIESSYELRDAFVTLGGEKSSFKMQVAECHDETLEYRDQHGYLTLLSDTYIDIPIRDNCKFAITSEISFNYLQNSFEGNQKRFSKSPQTRFLYEKGSVFIEPSDKLIANINNSNLQKIGMNRFAYTGGKDA